MLKYVTHASHPGVRAPMRQQEALDRHIEGGWELEDVQESVQVEKPAPKQKRKRRR